jgi:hypothetical protein
MISQLYVPCDDTNIPIISFEWAGFHTNTQTLSENGWLVKCLYNRFIKKWVMRFYHPTLFMTFALKVDSISELKDKVTRVDFISIGGRRNRRPLKAEDLHELNSNDVPLLLEVAIDLQKDSRKKQIKAVELPEAEIIQYFRLI